MSDFSYSHPISLPKYQINKSSNATPKYNKPLSKQKYKTIDELREEIRYCRKIGLDGKKGKLLFIYYFCTFS